MIPIKEKNKHMNIRLDCEDYEVEIMDFMSRAEPDTSVDTIEKTFLSRKVRTPSPMPEETPPTTLQQAKTKPMGLKYDWIAITKLIDIVDNLLSVEDDVGRC
jgi:hypothetical protein